MLNRRRALAILGTAGLGTVVFQRALAAKAAEATVSRQMVMDAEWVAGIKLTEAQRETTVNALKWAAEEIERVRVVELDNSQLPGLAFVPFASPEARPDPRGYEVVKSAESDVAAISRPESDEDLAFSSIRQLGAMLRSRKISSVELTRIYLERLRRYDPLLKCVVTFMDDLALKQAQQADQELQSKIDRGPLHGIPWGLKDIFAYPGCPTTWGVTQYRDRIINVKSAVAERLDNAGAVLIAKLATNTLAGGSEMWFRGMTRNPWNPRKGALGSSSGSAAAAAAGLVGFSIGTETTGSIMGPSVRCGAVGLRPTYGRVSRFGCMQVCWSLDKVGPICRNVDDCGLILSAIHGADPRDLAAVDRQYVWPSSRSLSTIRVGYVPRSDREKQAEDLEILRKLGVTLVPVEPPNLKKDFGLTVELNVGVVASESASAFEHLTRHGLPKGVKGWPQYLLLGHFLSAVDYLKLNRLRTIIMQRHDKLMQSVDVCFCHEWNLDGNTGDDSRGESGGDQEDVWEFYGNLTGHPTITIPKKFVQKGDFQSPRPLTLIGRIYDESTLMMVADACQKAIGLKSRPPLDKSLANIDEILAEETFPDEDRYYVD